MSRRDKSLAGKSDFETRGNGLTGKSARPEIDLSRQEVDLSRQEVEFSRQGVKVSTQKELMEILFQEMENIQFKFFPDIDLVRVHLE